MKTQIIPLMKLYQSLEAKVVNLMAVSEQTSQTYCEINM